VVEILRIDSKFLFMASYLLLTPCFTNAARSGADRREGVSRMPWSKCLSVERLLRLHGTQENKVAAAGDDGRGGNWGDLLAAAQRGDAEAYRGFLKAVLPFVRAIARRRCWSEDMADDVLQDVLLTVHRVRHTYQPGRPVEPWLAAIVVRRSIDATRKRGRIGRQEVFNEAAYETFADPRANDPLHADASRTLARMTEGLPRGQKEAIELVKIKEMTLAEASIASGQSIASLKVNIHRAMKKLRLNLDKDPPE
jgi:RNA polymerase sigma-70 factor (ECF subfamily)